MKRKVSVSHVFGYPDSRPTLGERLCNEPAIDTVEYETIYHVHFDTLDDGNLRCKHCSQQFID